MNQVINEDLIPVRVIDNSFFIKKENYKDELILDFVSKNNKTVFVIKASLLGDNMISHKSIVGDFQFNYVKNLIVFDSADFSDSGQLLNLRMFIIDFKGNIILDLKHCYMNTVFGFSNKSFIYFYKSPSFKNKKVCFLKDDLSIVGTSYSKFEKTVLNGFLVSSINSEGKKIYGLFDKDFNVILDCLHEEDLDLRTLLNC